MNNRLINTKVAGGGGGCTDIVDNYDPFGGNGVALYQLNGDATDVSGNYNGTATNVTYGTGVFGQAAQFNGTTSVIDTSITSLTDSYTFSLWFNSTAAPSVFGTISACREPNVYSACFTNNPNGTISFSAASGGSFINSSVLPLNTWHHAVGVKDGTTQYLYINGQLVSSGSTTTSVAITDQVRLGKYDNETTLSFTGSIDQVRIFNTALTPLEVEALYTEELCICDGTVDTLDILGDGSCIATYQLDGNANDLSGNYSGTPTNVSYGVGEFDLAGVFNGSSSKVDISSLSIPLNNFSYSLWFKANDTSSYQILILHGNGGRSYGVQLNNDANIGSYMLNSSAGTEYLLSNSITIDTNWHNVVITKSSTQGHKIYYDGNNIATDAAFTGNLLSGNFSNFLGSSGTSGYFNGSIDQVRIFNKALSAGEVTTLYNETACTKVTRTAGDTQILGDSSCVAYYKLDGNANDETGNYNGTFTNPNYGNGEFDYAAVFNGSSNYINLPDNSFKLSTITVSAWINSASTQNLQTIYSSYEYRLLQSRGFGIRLENSNLILFQGYNSNTNSNVFSSSQIQRNTWNHIVVVATQSSVSIYINGSLDNSGSISGFDYFINHPFSIGKNAQAVEHYFDGSIDQVRIFNRAINASEVTTLYNEGI